MTRCLVNGKETEDFEPEREWGGVPVQDLESRLVIEAFYDPSMEVPRSPRKVPAGRKSSKG